MGEPAEKHSRRRATYADLQAVPAGKVAELIRGTLHVLPRPAPRHARASSALGAKLTGAFDFGDSGPGGWWILDEPELHFPDPEAPGEIEAVAPDIAGWRRDRMPELPETAHIELVPDWVCEVLSKSAEDTDRNEKMPIYAREGVGHVWLVDPIERTVEMYKLGRGRRWSKPEIHKGTAQVKLPPFEAVELDLSALWV